jgi:plastocyanin
VRGAASRLLDGIMLHMQYDFVQRALYAMPQPIHSPSISQRIHGALRIMGAAVFVLVTSCSRPSSTNQSSTGGGRVPSREIAIRMSHYQFEPATIPVTPGEKVILVIRSKEGLHNFQAERLGIQARMLDTGEETRIETTIPPGAAGKEIPFVCT